MPQQSSPSWRSLLAAAVAVFVAAAAAAARRTRRRGRRGQMRVNAAAAVATPVAAAVAARPRRIAILNCPGKFNYVPFFLDMFRRVGVRPVLVGGGSDDGGGGGGGGGCGGGGGGGGGDNGDDDAGVVVHFQAFQCHEGQLPSAPFDMFDGYLVTGSTHGAYEGARLPWIARLGDALARLHAARRPLVGVCFGHQLVAHALGGRAAKNPRGWELGTAEFELSSAGRARLQQLLLLRDRRGGGDGAGAAAAEDEGAVPRRLRLVAVHGDEVADVPPGFTSLGGNAQTPVEGMVSDDLTVLTVQGHPEFTADAVRDLVHSIAAAADADPGSHPPGTHNNGVVSMASQGVSKEAVLASAGAPVQGDADAVARLFLRVFGVL